MSAWVVSNWRVRTIAGWARLVGVALLGLGLLCPAARGQTAAGARIVNVANAIYDLSGSRRGVASNPVADTVAERLDVALAANGASFANGDDVSVPVRLVNPGNGHEAYELSAAATGVEVRLIAIDVDRDGRFTAADTRLDGQTPELAPGGALALLIVARRAATGAGAAVTLTARATTGSGAPGTPFAGRGDGGGDAIVGPTTATATITVDLAAGAAPTLVKRQSVLAPDGSAQAMSGATITYVLEARFPAATQSARIFDEIPPGTRFVPGSVTLDGAPIADGTALAGATVVAALGDVPAGAIRIVQFKTVID